MTLDRNKILIVIPLYNHAATVREVAQHCHTLHERVLVVDDGSSDGGGGTLDGLDVQLLRHEVNRGKGAAIRTAAIEAARQRMTHIVTIDADGQHDPSDIPQILAVLARDPLSIVVGKRNFDTDNVPGSSRFGRKFSNFWLRLQTGQSLEDTQSGFRAYPLVVFEELGFRASRYSFEIEVLVKAAWAGVPLYDADISVYYPPPEKRISHFDKLRDNLRLTLLNTHLTLRSVTPWPHRKIVRQREGGHKVSLFAPLRSIRQLLSENNSPAQLAWAVVLGVVLGAAPLIACHTLAILFATGYFRLNKLAAVGASQLCMPPLVPALCIEVGYYLRHGEFLTEISWQTLGHQGLERLYEWLIGSLLVGPVLGVLVGSLVYGMALSLKRQRRVVGG